MGPLTASGARAAAGTCTRGMEGRSARGHAPRGGRSELEMRQPH